MSTEATFLCGSTGSTDSTLRCGRHRMSARDASTAQNSIGALALPVWPGPSNVLPHNVIAILERTLAVLAGAGMIDVAQGHGSADARRLLASLHDLVSVRVIPAGERDCERRLMEFMKMIRENNASLYKVFSMQCADSTRLYTAIEFSLAKRPLFQKYVRDACTIPSSSTSDGSSGLYDGALAWRLLLIELIDASMCRRHHGPPRSCPPPLRPSAPPSSAPPARRSSPPPTSPPAPTPPHPNP